MLQIAAKNIKQQQSIVSQDIKLERKWIQEATESLQW